MSEQLQQQYNAFKTLLQDLQQKLSEVEMDSEEHRLVLESLKNMDGDRKCMRMIGTVLVDKTVKEVIPVLEETKAGLDKAANTLREDLDKAQKDMDKWKKDNNVKIVGN